MTNKNQETLNFHSAGSMNTFLAITVRMLILLTMTLLCGCFSSSSLMNSYLEKIKISIFSQEDPEMVRQGVPTLILLMDAALAEDPDNPQLLRTASTIYATYAQAFIICDGEEERATILYSRANEYGVKLLCQRDFFAKVIDGPYEDFEKATLKFTKSDVPDLYAAGSAWIGWILSKPNSMEALSQLPKALNIMSRVLELDEKYADGGVHMLFGIYYAVQAPGAGRDMGKSLKHFKRAMELAGDNNLLPKVTFAEFYATAMQDEKLFDKILNDILKKDEHKKTDSKNRLINSVSKERAKKLKANKGNFF